MSDQQDSTVDRFFFQQVAARPLGDCATDNQAFQHWSYGILKGTLLCVTTRARAQIDWIYEG